jgi:hypothetical protein
VVRFAEEGGPGLGGQMTEKWEEETAEGAGAWIAPNDVGSQPSGQCYAWQRLKSK